MLRLWIKKDTLLPNMDRRLHQSQLIIVSVRVCTKNHKKQFDQDKQGLYRVAEATDAAEHGREMPPMSRAPRGATPSAIPNSSPCAKTPTSITSSGLFTTRTSSKSRHRAGPRMKPRYGITMTHEVPKKMQERAHAHASPIWYTP
jgi:hypothetical protein